MSFDKEEVRQHATGQWHAIASQAFGISDDFLTTKHGSCPKCGGGPSANRWRVFDDFQKTGGAICNQCGKTIGDGFALGQWFLGISFDESIAKVAEFLKLEEPKRKGPARKGKPSKGADDFGLEFITWRDRLFDVWAATKSPITAEAVKTVGGQFAKFHGMTVIAIPFTGRDGSTNGYALYNATGGTIPYRPDRDSEIQQLKVRNVGCKQESGWAGRFLPGVETVKSEGVTDMLAILSCDPGASVICNPFGAGENPRGKFNSWMLERLRGETVYVIHDCDKPGQEGATFTAGERSRPGWAPCIASIAKECRNVVLPYEITESHGRDARDFLNDQIAGGKSPGEAYQELISLARSSAAVEGEAEGEEEVDEEDRYYVDDPNRLAKANLKRYQEEYGRSLKYWNQTWYAWKAGQYVEIANDHLNSRITGSVQTEFENVWAKEVAAYKEWRKSPDYDPEKDKGVPKVRKVKGSLVQDVYLATRGMCSLGSGQKMHDWVREEESHDGVFVSVGNGILNVSKLISEKSPARDEVLLPHSPAWFSTAKLNFNFDPGAGCGSWLKFLDDVFNKDKESIDALQKWFGYLLTPDNSLQKIMFVIGRMRSGKGTIIHIMRELFGPSNVCTPKLGSLASQFALQSMANKTVAIIADARLSRHADDSLITETLLSISGGDPQDIDRKYKDTLSGYEMKCRFSIFSNLVPNLKDLSSAIVSRCIFLHMPNTYLGREDLGLLDRLKSEMSGILNWAIVGRHRLNEERKITQPAAGRKLIQELEELTSPVSLFIEEWCEFGSSQENDFSVETKHLFSKWEQYCNENDVEHPGSVQSFSRKIKAIRPEVTISQFRKSTTERGRKMLGIRLLDNPRSEKASPEPKF
jgi:P4 family phage/plasmid primase-like protien